MKTVFFLLVILGALLAMPSGLWAETEPLDSLIETLRTQNPELMALRQQIQAAKERVPQERSLMDPMIGVDIEGIPRRQFSYNNYMDIEYMVSQQIPFPGKRRLRGKMAEQGVALLEKEYQAREQQVALEFKKTYYQLYWIERSIQINQENSKLVEQISQIASAKYSTGQATQQDVIKAQVELAKLINETITLEQEKEIALAMANTFLARELNTEIPLPNSLGSQIPSFNWDLIEAQGLWSRPEVSAMAIAKEQAKTAVQVAKKEFFPDFQIRAEARQFNEENQIREFDTFLGVNLPIWFWTKQRAGLREKQAQLSATEAAYQAMRNQALFELQSAWIQVRSKQRIAELYLTTLVPQARQSVEAAKASYQADKSDFLTWIDAQRVLKEFQLEQERALVELHQSLAELERAVGGVWPEKTEGRGKKEGRRTRGQPVASPLGELEVQKGDTDHDA